MAETDKIIQAISETTCYQISTAAKSILEYADELRIDSNFYQLYSVIHEHYLENKGGLRDKKEFMILYFESIMGKKSTEKMEIKEQKMAFQNILCSSLKKLAHKNVDEKNMIEIFQYIMKKIATNLTNNLLNPNAHKINATRFKNTQRELESMRQKNMELEKKYNELKNKYERKKLDYSDSLVRSQLNF